MSFNIWEGKVVKLRPIETSDWEEFHKDGLDSEIARLNDTIYGPRTQEGTRKWTEDESNKGWDGHHFRLAIENHDGDLVGSINTFDCDSRNGTFYYGVSIFREYWKKGYASDAVKIILRYFFDELRYQKANALVYNFNEGSIHLHNHLGFTKEGCLRNMVYTNGEYHDILTKEEFQSF
ncbi:GNAT family N-acetyltransferase [Chengkuizengella axinellae]|uniref:GNAT family N-acetyltransferase n=1 Tax=Chengkuizengella axinellae TaxID=3064388 RepID=A0ABT9J3U3_9BACL|nr:GNAT family N-acetyltransferase [Chengkuizengella sp. 2205SS18-9]MDP5276274.1 GNAT family N-acetyltransferase [Chengkuizengella sp. 2205SS18-9]